MLNNFTVIIDRVKTIKGEKSTAAFAKSLGMTQQTVDQYLKLKNKPSLEFILKICSVFTVSADWLLGLPTAGNGPSVSAGAGSAVNIGSGSATAGGDCSKCQLMQEHVRRITGRA